ncbi:MAG: MarR family transcriptional regulator [Devosia nanyangense]|uniref:MarR family transcriptional regulator n=1 Tax=Devosia nanyangense TaxID=1228055 RepID=A0A933L0K4_9HYPH|nr:MarR family transcriptional regulator [Devosia nanyangense]
MADDFSQCMVSNSRMAARAITRRYDAYLRPYGMTATQLSLMGAIRMLPGLTVSALAEARGFDRTTLTRNLDKLEERGLVVSMELQRGNGRLAAITGAGDGLLDQLLPLWREAQADLRTELSPETFDDSIKTLKRLAKV